jgi:hypothetical protein
MMEAYDTMVIESEFVMAILPIYYNTTNLTRKRKASSPTRASEESARKTAALLARVGYVPRQHVAKKAVADQWQNDRKVAPMTDTIPGGIAAKRDKLNDHKWKRGLEETKETIKEIQNKAARTAPAYSKGAYQYITDGADTKTLGRKI